MCPANIPKPRDDQVVDKLVRYTSENLAASAVDLQSSCFEPVPVNQDDSLPEAQAMAQAEMGYHFFFA